MAPKGVSAHLKAIIYKTYCLTQFTYALETTTLPITTRQYLNIDQNNVIRQFIGLNKFCHMSGIISTLRILPFEDLYLCSKLSFLETIKNNDNSMEILNFICRDLHNTKKNSKSFKKDVILLQNTFNLDIELILAGPYRLLNEHKKYLDADINDPILSSISVCLNNLQSKEYKQILDELTRPQFLKDHIKLMHEIIDGQPFDHTSDNE
jgi:hypothetical protein